MSDRMQRRDDRRRPSRSRSPSRQEHHAHRTRSPHHHRRRHKQPPARPAPKELPYGARQLTKRDFAVFKPMFALYLDIQKQKVFDDLDEVEAKGRWKSFMGKWNRGELAEGWYDPLTLQKAIASASEPQDTSRDFSSRREGSLPRRETKIGERSDRKGYDSSSESDDSVGPTLPGKEGRSRFSRMGPSIPRADDLELKREMEEEDAFARIEDMRSKRKADRKLQREALDELVPRAEAGTFERRLEKKATVNATMKSFRDRSPGAPEVPDSELMGGGGGGDDDGLSDFKKQKQEYERKKNERELRKEEFLRARAAERQERLQDYAAKEEKTMAMLKELAKQRFG